MLCECPYQSERLVYNGLRRAAYYCMGEISRLQFLAGENNVSVGKEIVGAFLWWSYTCRYCSGQMLHVFGREPSWKNGQRTWCTVQRSDEGKWQFESFWSLNNKENFFLKNWRKRMSTLTISARNSAHSIMPHWKRTLTQPNWLNIRWK